MFRLRRVNLCLRRLLHLGAANRDQVLERLQACSVEDQVFDVVSKNISKLTVDHVSCAVRLLWQFQIERPEVLRTIDLTKRHPQFFTLQVLAENKITLMDDSTLLNLLYAFMRMKVEPHDTLVQQMVLEAWQRIDGLSMKCLSKFAVCLKKQKLSNSPLMGRITSILDQKLSTIDDVKVLSSLMFSVMNLVSPRLSDALMVRTKQLLSTECTTNVVILRRVMQFMHFIRYTDIPLLEMCNKILLHSVSSLDLKNICGILSLYPFHQFDFKLAAKERLIELMDTSTDPYSFTILFATLAPIASMEIIERLESMALLLADEFNAHQALAITKALEEIQSKNFSLLNKIVSVIQKNLHVYNSWEVARFTRSLILLQYQNSQLFATLRKGLLSFLHSSLYPAEVTLLTQVLSKLPSPQLEEGVVLRVNEVAPQCNLRQLVTISSAVSKWVQSDPFYHNKIHSEYVCLLQRLRQCSCERLQTADQLNLVLDDLKYVTREWFEDMLFVDTMFTTLNRMIDQIKWNNVSELAFFLYKTGHLHRPLLDRLASVAVEHIDKICFRATNAILLPFSVMNYNPAQADELYNACIKCFTSHKSSFEPHSLVQLAYNLASVGHFPEELVREIFSLDFLIKLDSELEWSKGFGEQMRLLFMFLNRAVCLECPQFQIPWLHERYCQQRIVKRKGSVTPVLQEIHKMLGEILGGINFVQRAVVTPYCYTVDFECKLGKHLEPLCYSEPSSLQISSKGKALWNTGSPKDDRDDLPPGAQRIVVNFLGSSCFCKNSHHMTGRTVIRKRHLEIMGYRVVQIPHFEWNSMELSTHDSWKDYLQKKIFG